MSDLSCRRSKARTYTEGAATAFCAVVWLMFLTCSRTLDLASSMEALEPTETVDLARVKAMALLVFVALGMRIFAAESDMILVALGQRPRAGE